MANQLRANLISKHFSKRKESEIEEIKKIEKVKYRREIEKEHKGIYPMLQKIK